MSSDAPPPLLSVSPLSVPLLSVQGLAAAYRGLRALHGVDLTVAAGEIVAVVGANGAGKSTLLRAISGQMQITGKIIFDGTPIGRLPAHQITRMGIGLV